MSFLKMFRCNLDAMYIKNKRGIKKNPHEFPRTILNKFLWEIHQKYSRKFHDKFLLQKIIRGFSKNSFSNSAEDSATQFCEKSPCFATEFLFFPKNASKVPTIFYPDIVQMSSSEIREISLRNPLQICMMYLFRNSFKDFLRSCYSTIPDLFQWNCRKATEEIRAD